MPTFSFPDVSPQEILTILAELQIPVPEGLLTKPTPEAVKVVYREFVVILTGVQREVRHPAAVAAVRAGRRGAGAARRSKPLLTPRLVRVSVWRAGAGAGAVRSDGGAEAPGAAR